MIQRQRRAIALQSGGSVVHRKPCLPAGELTKKRIAKGDDIIVPELDQRIEKSPRALHQARLPAPLTPRAPIGLPKT